METVAPADVPANAEQLCEWYRPYVVKLCHKQGIPAQDAEDAADEILMSLIRNKNNVSIIDQYNPDLVFEHGGTKRRATFRNFLSAKVVLYCKGKREKIGKNAAREMLLLDSAVSEDGATSWVDLFGGAEWDDYSSLDADEFVARMRAYLASVPRRSDRDYCDLVGLFDELVREVREEGSISYASVMARFGISDTTAASWIGRLRQELSGAVDTAVSTVKVTIGAVSLGPAEMRTAVEILRSNGKSTQVANPLRHAGHILGTAEKGWYHPIAQAEIELYPEIAVDPGTRQKHKGHVKLAIIHFFERQLGLAVEPAIVKESTTENGPSVAGSTKEYGPEPEPTATDLLTYELFRLGADAPTVDRCLELARAVA